jgi:signal transduction histidine kinase
MTDNAPIKVLLVEDNPGDARLAQEVLADAGSGRFEVVHAARLSDALELLADPGIHVVLLDLSLPDASGMETVDLIQAGHPYMPIVVLSGLDDDVVALEAVQRGAQDYLAKGEGSSEVMARSIRYAIERKREQRLLMEEKERAELATRARSEFLATMSHELRTPLNAIIGFSEAISEELLGPMEHPTYKQYVQDIHASGMHLLEIINDILDLANIDAGSATLHEESVDIGEVVRASMRMVEQRAADAGIAAIVRVGDDMPQLWADKRLIRQILVNLLSNSVKFTAKGGSVTVDAELVEGNALSLSVADTGIGIAKADIAKAMTPFGQVDGSLSRKYAGTGLGLPLAKRLVELHGGTLRLESKIDIGTKVTVCFPSERLLIDGPVAIPPGA